MKSLTPDLSSDSEPHNFHVAPAPGKEIKRLQNLLQIRLFPVFTLKLDNVFKKVHPLLLQY
jgi:hypothetical protein